ncbi:ATP-binding protein [Pseudooceanicola sp.]|uniref:HAMP domain-containing sensor histidine kinase n=2 Tax=Pseudooceanicola sp. TaxID=1914328 RepID=UPI0035C6915A
MTRPARRPRLARASVTMTLAVAAVIILAALGAMALQYRVTAASLATRQAELLAADLASFETIYDQRRIPALREAVEFRASATPEGSAIYLLQDRARTTLAGNTDGWPEGITASGEGFAPAPQQSYVIDGVAYRGVARILPGGFPFLAARAETPALTTLADLRALIWQVALGLVALSLIAGWLVSSATLGRIARINALADRVAAGDLSARLPGPRSRDEFGALEAHVHQMLDRIETLDRARTRLADMIAHELRTPLNRIRQRLGGLTGDDEALERIDADMASTIRIFDSLLDISSAEAAHGQRPGLVPIDLSTLAEEVAELYAPLAEDSGMTLTTGIAPGAQILGERNLVAQALTNLIDNAIKYCDAGDDIRLDLTGAGDRWRMSIADTGPGVPDDLRERAFDLFTRAERDVGKSGHGLGLALVKAIALRHGARIDLLATEKGFRIEILWPKLPDT